MIGDPAGITPLFLKGKNVVCPPDYGIMPVNYGVSLPIVWGDGGEYHWPYESVLAVGLSVRIYGFVFRRIGKYHSCTRTYQDVFDQGGRET